MKRIENKSSRTAAFTCTCRASSYMEKDPCFKSNDDISVKLLPHFWKFMLKQRFLNLKSIVGPKGIYPYVIARTKFIDTVLEDALNADTKQVLILGAGFDSRAVRYLKPESDVKIFEVDAPATLNAKVKQFKKRNIKIPENNIYVSVDFTKEDVREKLLSRNFISNTQTLFILEGLTMYLTAEAVYQTFKFIIENSAPDSFIVFDYIYASVLRKEMKYYGESAIYSRVKKENEEWTFGIEEGEIEKFLNNFNLFLIEHLNSETLENKYFLNDKGEKVTRINGTHCIVLARK
ncbi:MAG: SAM-dependent methyltransferase [Prolixibacteraceae bacterium]|nr:SAM-dependent methyltransferase [Prolixibacteraceae bacterium]